MKSTRLVFCMVLLACSPLFSRQDHTSTANDLPQADPIVLDLSTLIVNDSLFLSYFFEELKIVDYQQAQLKNIVFKKRKERQTLVADWLEEGKQASRSKRAYDKLSEEFAEEVQKVLLPNQVSELRCLTRQRAKLVAMNGVESFVLPLFLTSELELSKKQISDLKETLQEVSGNFEKEKQSLSDKCWDEISKLMPDDSAKSLIELATLAPGVERLDVSKRRRISDFKNWTSEDFQEFEKSRYNLAAVVAVGHEPLKNAIGIMDYQVSEFQLVYKETIESHDTNDFADPVIAQLILATPPGRLEKLKADTRKKLEKREQFDADMADRIANDVLLPAQNEKLKNLAQFIRWMYETKMNDEFGIIIAWSKTIDTEGFDTKSFEKQVKKTRAMYYKKLREMRESKCSEVLESLPEPARKKFKQLFGAPYDYEAEKISAWDDLRK